MAMDNRSGFTVDELFQMSDSRVPLGTEHALRGLIKPFESIFPNSVVPNADRAASEFINARMTRTPQQPPDLEMKKDWVEWILWELRLRFVLADRFNWFRDAVSETRPRSRDGRIVLFLREFRDIEYYADVGAQRAVRTEIDNQLRDKIELMFPEHPVLWIANPRDDLNRSFYNETYQQKVNDNSIPYIASEDWLGSVKLISEAADVIVMSNTKSSGGVAQEVDLLKHMVFSTRHFSRIPIKLTRKLNNFRVSPI